MNEENKPPKLFLSYSWSSPEHEAFVVRLANELTEAGVHVVLDKWDLKEGQEANAFMEKMVTDPEINKVAMICDATYKKKADERKGGVGTESQIISQKVYETQEQSKFVSIVVEKDEEGKALVPAYYSSRIYIDLSEEDKYLEEFERLVRWVFDKPLYVRPTLGEPPSYLKDGPGTTSGTSTLARRAVVAIRESKPHARAALNEYFSAASRSLERYRLDIAGSGQEADDLIIACLEEMLPFRDEIIGVLHAVANYSQGNELAQSVHHFFEEMAPFLERPEGHRAWTSWSADNFRFFINELFLYTTAIFLSGDRLDLAEILLGQRYYVENASEHGRSQMAPHTLFRGHIESLEHRNKRLGLGRVSLQADILKKRAEHSGVRFNDLMQADFIAYLRAVVENEHWWPVTLLYSTFGHCGAFELFARAESKVYFGRLSKMLGFEKPLDFAPKLKELGSTRSLPRWQFEQLDIARLSNWDNLTSKP